jgi:hypothetical protein
LHRRRIMKRSAAEAKFCYCWKILKGFYHSAQGCAARATLGQRPNQNTNPNGVVSPGHPMDSTLSGLCLCRLSTQRRPTLPANAGLDDGIPLGCSETARRRGDRSSSKKLDCCESVAGSEDFPVPVKNFAPWARMLGL